MSSTYETRGMRVIMDPHGSAWIRKGGQECVSIQRFKHLWTLDMRTRFAPRAAKAEQSVSSAPAA